MENDGIRCIESNTYQGQSKLMKNYGWVQNTSNLSTIRETVALIPEGGCTHNELMIKIYNYRLEKGNIKKKWTWDARCRIKAICATGMARLDRSIQGYQLTALGRSLVDASVSTQTSRGKRQLSSEEIELFKKGLLTNPPVIRVLALLNENRKNGQKSLSKYDVGSNLGFVGDIGFTHYEPEYVVSLGKSFNDSEGDADKWARTIISWLKQVGWVISSGYDYILGRKLPLYTTGVDVDSVLRYGARSATKYIPEEMLCSAHHPFATVVQKRRVEILKHLNTSNKRICEADALMRKLNDHGIDTDLETLTFDILNLMQAGINITREMSMYKLNDTVDIDERNERVSPVQGKVAGLEKEIEHMVTKYADLLPSRLVDNLIRYSLDGVNHASLFEINVSKFFSFIGYKSEYLGQGQGRVADVIVKYKATSYPKSYAIIVDAKAYRKKYNFPVADVRKMKEYIQSHGPQLLQEQIPKHSFAFVSYEFTDSMEKINEIAKETNVSGTAITVYSLLELGAKVLNKNVDIADLYEKFTTNESLQI